MSSTRFILLLCGLIFSLVSCKSRTETTNKEDVYYTCSMHPQIISDKPGTCPICQMDLIAVSKSGSAAKDEIMLSDQQIQLGNIKVDTLRKRMIGNRTVLTATLNIDQKKTNAVSARIMGRIDRLYYRNVGDFVKKGEPIYELYSEELNNAKQEYLLALEKRRVLGNGIVDFQDLMQSAKNKLLLWGLTEGQIKQMERLGKASIQTTFFSPYSGYITGFDALEGQYVMEGGIILRLAELTTLWAEAQAYTAQLSQIDMSANAEVQIPGLPEFNTHGTIEFINPETNTASRITLLRVIVPNNNNRLRPGMPAYVFIRGKQTNAVTLPIDAVIRDSRGATVWIQTGKNTYRSRMVSLGIENNGFVEIASGLDTNDVVVTSGAYLINSEYVFKKGSDPMAGHQH
ncbi:MAG TPA: efflux RND transporter periplasmic adaptor subunit [Flavipsychrobacter sp.]|nr:efflux RND transporter periplasmic adaptor subunit [Flavipsychrobacter sp.]